MQPAQIRLPADGNNTRDHAPESRVDVSEQQRRDGGPQLCAVDQTYGEGDAEAVKGFGNGGAGEERLGGEEVGVEDGGEDGLGDDDFCGDGEAAGSEVEVAVEEHEPADRWISQQ